MNRTQKTPFVHIRRAVVDHIGGLMSRVRTVHHRASYREGEPGLAELVRHRAVMVEPLYERRIILPDTKIVVMAHLKYVDELKFFGKGKYIHPGEVIAVEFIIGNERGEFVLTGGCKDLLPRRVLFHWNGTNDPGRVTQGFLS